MNRHFAAAVTTLLVLASPSQAQTPSQRLAERARAEIDNFAFDKARALLDSTLRVATTPGERIRGWTLIAFAQLGLKNRMAARQAFEQALKLDATLRIDSLDLDADAPLVFAEARTIVAASAQVVPQSRLMLLMTVLLPVDTVVLAGDARLPMIVQPNAASRVVTTFAAAGAPGLRLWSDSQAIAGRTRLALPMRRSDGTVWPDGAYRLRLQAVDSVGQATAEERVIRLARMSVDTQAHPPQLTAAAFAPEAKPGATHLGIKLFAGMVVSAMAAAAPLALGSPDLNVDVAKDPASYAVAGGVALASVVGFVAGKRPRPLPENILKNRQLREADQRTRDAIARRNADARANAPMRITVERVP